MIIASRILHLIDGASKTRIEIRLFAPAERDSAWWCAYEIDWPKATWKSAAGGIDSLQAIQMALQKIGAEIYTSESHRSGKLVWDRAGNGYGFPVPQNIRHMLVGDDAFYD